jgi:hypothetical protein
VGWGQVRGECGTGDLFDRGGKFLVGNGVHRAAVTNSRHSLAGCCDQGLLFGG